LIFLNKRDIFIPRIDFKPIIDKLKKLDESPAFLIPCVLIDELFSHDLLIRGKILIADDIVKISRKGYFEERFKDRVSVIG